MNETMVCVVGNVATQPVCRELSTGASARFRLAVTSRYWDREKNEWTDGHTNFFTVWARRTLAANVASSVALGDPVVVQGRLKVRTETAGRAELGLGGRSTRSPSATISRGAPRRSGVRRPTEGARPPHRPAPNPVGRPRWPTRAGREPDIGGSRRR